LRVSFVGPTGTPLAAPLGDGAPSLLRAMLLARFRRLLRHRLLWRGSTPPEPRPAAWRGWHEREPLPPAGAR